MSTRLKINCSLEMMMKWMIWMTLVRPIYMKNCFHYSMPVFVLMEVVLLQPLYLIVIAFTLLEMVMNILFLVIWLNVRVKDQNKDNADSSQSIQEHFFLDERFTYWGENDNDVTDGSTKFQFPAEVTKFLKIVSMHSELIVLADNGKLYGWSWEIDSTPNNSPHLANSFLFPIIEGEADVDSILDIESCGLRTAVLTKSGHVGSFVDISCGNRLGRILSETPIEVAEPIGKLLCCTLYSAILTKDGNIFWRKLWEKIRSRKKQVTFESGGTEIVVGSEVRTKSTPIYSFGSIAVNFSQGIPMIGVLYEDAWTLNETCRFWKCECL
ncbi:hypothetical protein ACQ4LE_008078 [Meloidogyne hapla]